MRLPLGNQSHRCEGMTEVLPLRRKAVLGCPGPYGNTFTYLCKHVGADHPS